MSYELDLELSELCIPEGFQDRREVEWHDDTLAVRCANSVFTSAVTVEAESQDTRRVLLNGEPMSEDDEDGWITLDEVSGSEDESEESVPADLGHTTAKEELQVQLRVRLEESVRAEPPAEDVNPAVQSPGGEESVLAEPPVEDVNPAMQSPGGEESVLAEPLMETTKEDQVSNPQAKRAKRANICSLCQRELAWKNNRRHYENEHLPFWWTPYAACELCSESEQSLCFLRQRHLNREDHGEAARFATDDDLLRWVARVTGSLHFFRVAFNQNNLDALLRHVVREKLVARIEFFGSWEGCLQALDQYLGIPYHEDHSEFPPQCVSSLLHWRNVISLLEVLAPETRDKFRSLDVRASADGPLHDASPVAPWTQALSTVDAHCHLDRTLSELKIKSFAALRSQHSAGRRLPIVVSNFVFPDEWDGHKKFQGDDEVIYTFGIHPHCASERPWDISKLQELLKHEKAAAVGELGLNLPADNIRDQEALVREQLRLAVDVDLPVVVHCKGPGAYRRMLDIMGRILPRSHRIQLHCFEGDHQLTVDYIKSFPNVMFSLGGLLFHQNAELESAVQGLEISRLLLETDSPYLSPPGVPYHKNQPWNVYAVAQRVARLKNLPVRVVVDTAAQNARKLFGM